MRFLLIALVLAACGGSTETAEPVDYQAEYGGSSTVYAAIASNTDCDELQETFDGAAEVNDASEPGTAQQRSSLGYMTATQDQMEALGCD
jgi:hypothetical protein